MCELTGYDRTTILERGAAGLLVDHPEAELPPEQVPEIIDRVMAGEAIDPYEQVIQTKSGEQVWLEVNPTRAVIDGTEQFLAISRDITERKRREREYEQIFNGVNDAIAVHDADTGRIIDVNDSYQELFGYDRERILETGIDGLSATEEGYTADRARALIREVAATDEDETVEWRIRTADDERRTVESSLTVAEVGGTRRVLSMIRDVTERRRREQEYEQIFDGVNDAITIHDPDTAEMLAVNETFCEMVGYDREAVLDMEISEFSRDDIGYTTERGREFIQAISDSGEPDQTEWALETADGTTRWVEVHGSIAEIDGKRRFLAIDRDITEAKRREREFEQIFDGVNDAISVHHPDTGEILRANEPYLELLGYDSVEQVRELGIGGLSATEEGYTAEAGKQLIREAGQQSTPTTVEWRAERADGKRLWLEATLTPGDVGGEPRVLSIQRDVTERKRREQQLAVFNRVLRHNLRNRVDVIRSHAETLREQATADSHAQRIIDNADRLATLGTRVRDADRLLRREPQPRRLDLAEMVRAVIDDLTTEATDVTVRTAFPAESTVRADEEAVRMIVESALTNAIEHATDVAEVRLDATDDGYTIEVHDDGPGIPGGELETLHTGTESMLRHSRGLGLWRIQWATDLLNGRLSFDIDDGTTVAVTLPVHPDDTAAGA
jgi:PAS domain S-box-containing protein